MSADESGSPRPPEKTPGQSDPKLLETAFLLPGAETESGRLPKSATAAAKWIGRTLGKYQITDTLGQGGMGVVFRAHDPMIERDVAIKLLPEEFAENDSALNRFLAEAKAAGKLNHPNVVSIYEIGQEGRTYFLVMELIPGGSVSDRLSQEHAYSVLEATRIVMDACKGLSAAHAAGLIHRDIKPANLMRGADGSIKITDFGLAKTMSPRALEMTQAGLVCGTPYFMSPEQCDGKAVDARSDIYSLGATFYSLLTGKNPYQDSESVIQVMFGHCRGPIPDPRLANALIPSACSAIIARAMAKSPADRYQSAAEMLADLQAVAATLSGEVRIDLPSQSGVRQAVHASESTPQTVPAKSSRRLWIGGAIGATLLTGVAAGFWKWPFGSHEKAAPIPPVASAGEPIRVGVLHSMSGTMAGSETVVVDATLLAIDEINQSGGLLGRLIKPIVVDARSDTATFVREAERLITQEKVCTVFGCWTSASRKAVKPIFEEHNHLLIYPLQYEGVEVSPNIIYMGAAPNQQIIPALDWATTVLKKRRFFLVGSDYVFPRTANAIIRDHLTSHGAEIVGEEYLPLGSQDVSAAVDAIVLAKPDMILNTINGDSNTAFFRTLRAKNITPADIPCLSFSVAEQELRSLNIAEVQGDYAAWTYFQSVQSPENNEFVRRFHEKYPQRVISDPMEAAYVGVKLWAMAVKSADSLDPTKIRRAMLNQRFDAPDGNTRVDPDTQHCFKTPRVGQIKPDGQFEIVWAAPAPVRPMPFPSSRSAADWKAFLNDLYTGWGNQWSAP